MNRILLKIANIGFCALILVTSRPGLCRTTLEILISTRNNGVLRDCECGDDCHGGLAERATQIASFRKNNAPVLLLDGGDFSSTIGRQRNDEFVLQAYRQLNYDAIAVGDQEFRNGMAFFQRKTLTANLPLVCANLRLQPPAQSQIQPFIIKKINGLKVAITGCLSPAALSRIEPEKYDPAQIQPVEPALRQLLPELDRQADVIVLLAQVTPPELEHIARALDGISVIVAGHQPGLPEDSFQEKYGKLIVSAGVESAYLAHLTLVLNAAKQIENSYFNLICASPEIPEAADIKNLVDGYFAEFEILNHRFGPKTQGLSFYGPDYCRQCHVVAWEIWRTSRHADAFESLKLKSAEANRACWPCHSMFARDSSLAPASRQIGCEACHIFTVDPAKAPHPDQPSKTGCSCHTAKYSPEFDFKVYWDKIKH